MVAAGGTVTGKYQDLSPATVTVVPLSRPGRGVRSGGPGGSLQSHLIWGTVTNRDSEMGSDQWRT